MDLVLPFLVGKRWYSFKKNFIYLFIFREKGREGEREGEKHRRERGTWISCCSWAPCPGTKPTTQACALTENRTSDLPLCRTTPKQLSHAEPEGNSCFIVHLAAYETSTDRLSNLSIVITYSHLVAELLIRPKLSGSRVFN